MGRLALLVGKDLRRELRSPLGLILTLAFPVLFSALLALTFGGRGDRVPRVVLLVEDRDDSLASRALLAASTNEQMARYFDVRKVGADGREALERGEASALLRIPKGFGEDYLAGRVVRLELVRNPAQGILPEIAEQSLEVLADVLSSASRALREPLARIGEMTAPEGASPSSADVASTAVLVHAAVERVEGLVFPPRITLETVDEPAADAPAASGGGNGRGNIFLAILPGVAVWSLFLIGDLAMRDLMTEGTLGTLRRQVAGPIRVREIVLGKAAFAATLAAASLVILSAIGWAVAQRPVDLAGYLLLSAVVILAVTGFAATIYGAARSERQGATVSNLLLLAFAFSGGSFIPVEALPAALRSVAPVSPFYWGGQGYRALVQDGAGVREILPHVAILAGLGLSLGALGTLLLARRVRRGVTA